jgi:hypothetical protein
MFEMKDGDKTRKNDSRVTNTHKECRYRCFLPDLAEFAILCCAGPAIKVELYRLAERVRFELTVLSYTRFPGVHLKPLGHLSISVCIKKCVVLCKLSLAIWQSKNNLFSKNLKNHFTGEVF